MPFAKLVEFNNHCVDVLPSSDIGEIEPSVFNFSPSSSLSGVSYCCSSSDCRFNRIDRLSTFAALYLDKLIIPGFILKLPDELITKIESNSQAFRTELIQGIQAIFQYKPLMDAGIAVVTYDRSGLCPDCFTNSVNELSLRLYKKIKANVGFTYIRNGVVSIQQKNGYTDIYARASQVSTNFKGKKMEYPYVVHDASQHHELFKSFFNPIVSDIVLHRESIINGRSSYLTNRVADGEILEIAKYRTADQNTSSSLLSGMRHILPFIEGSTIDRIIELRQKDGEAFVLYRESIRQLFKSVHNGDAKVVKEAVEDLVKPEILKINRLITVHRDKFARKLKRQVIYNSLMLTAGVAASILTKSYEPLVGSSALIGFHPLSDTTETLIEARRIPDEAKTNAYYFLWKLVNPKS